MAFPDQLQKRDLEKVAQPVSSVAWSLVAWQEETHLHKAAFSFAMQHLAQTLPKQGFLHCALRKGHTNRPCKRASMSKWKRKKYELTKDKHEQESLSPLCMALLEQFASGMSASSLQHDVVVLLL